MHLHGLNPLHDLKCFPSTSSIKPLNTPFEYFKQQYLGYFSGTIFLSTNKVSSPVLMHNIHIVFPLVLINISW